MAGFHISGDPLDFLKGCTIDFDLTTGLSQKVDTGKRYLSQMKGMFADEAAFQAALEKEDSLIYEFHGMPVPETAGDLAFGCSILNPGKIGDEYYFTKGHFHTRLETSEVYYTLSGEGYMVMENPEGSTAEIPLKKNESVYVPRRYAHRTVNTGSVPLILFFVFDADAGHNYGTIETKGYHKRVVDRDGKPAVIDNLKW